MTAGSASVTASCASSMLAAAAMVVLHESGAGADAGADDEQLRLRPVRHSTETANSFDIVVRPYLVQTQPGSPASSGSALRRTGLYRCRPARRARRWPPTRVLVSLPLVFGVDDVNAIAIGVLTLLWCFAEHTDVTIWSQSDMVDCCDHMVPIVARGEYGTANPVCGPVPRGPRPGNR